MIYLDHCATTPMSEEALQTYAEAARSFFGNEQSLHDKGEEARQLLEHCRKEIAHLFNGHHEGVYFTSGGSDSNILSLLSLAYGRKKKGKHIITSPLEHPSIYQALDKLQQEGFLIEETAVKPNGQVCLNSLERLIREDTVLVTICHASSETGVIQPIGDIGRLLPNEVVFHSDMVQTFAKVPIDVENMGVDAISVSSHKVYGPKNTGACYISPRLRWKGVYTGVTHQNGFRPGTVDVPGIAAFTTAAVTLHDQLERHTEKWRSMQKFFLQKMEGYPVFLFGDKEQRLPHHLALRTEGREGQWLMLEAGRHGISFSSGSACKTSQSAPPKSLLAMGHTEEEAHGLFRISFGTGTTWEELETTAATLQRIIRS